jgi:hypothetical protein
MRRRLRESAAPRNATESSETTGPPTTHGFGRETSERAGKTCSPGRCRVRKDSSLRVELAAPGIHCPTVVSIEKRRLLLGRLESRLKARSSKGGRVDAPQKSRPRGLLQWLSCKRPSRGRTCRPPPPTKFVASWLHRHRGPRPRHGAGARWPGRRDSRRVTTAVTANANSRFNDPGRIRPARIFLCPGAPHPPHRPTYFGGASPTRSCRSPSPASH